MNRGEAQWRVTESSVLLFFTFSVGGICNLASYHQINEVLGLEFH